MITLFLDIETLPEYKTYAELPQHGKDAFCKRFKRDIDALILPPNDIEKERFLKEAMEKIYTDNASFHAEFSRIICISVGSVIVARPADNKPEYIFIKGLIGTELEILNAFLTILHEQKPDNLCAHNGKAFDFPFICRRLIINGYALPPILNIMGKKPWEVHLDDTMEMWRFTDLKAYTSMITLTYALNIESPKTDLDGSMVKEAFFNGEIVKIKDYCNGDVLALMRVYQKLNWLAPIGNVKMV